MLHARDVIQNGCQLILIHGIENGRCTFRRDCRSPGKHPIFSKWENKAKCNIDIISNWYKVYPNASIGILTGVPSQLAMIDVDPRHGVDVIVRKLIESNHSFSGALQTYSVATGGDGLHYCYQNDDHINKVINHHLGRGIDALTG
jgi:hypothetical protein